MELTLRDPINGRALFARAWEWAKLQLADGHQLQLVVKKPTRSAAQNRRMWAMLADVSRQVDWHGQKLTGAEWKDVFTAALKRQKVVPGIDGGFVVLGSSTSKMDKAQMGELMDLMEAFGAQQGVRFRSELDFDPETGEIL